ncbi:MAG: hypothetical protein EAZ57_11380 [Cytophagales bacterium]|nr:MAG: hypothetical protein EAZ67_12315 [Cytophagales bacterium]TAF59362.1 MAG: hypothetical protein EAZ57_11380 [Cytophagales bacterium]
MRIFFLALASAACGFMLSACVKNTQVAESSTSTSTEDTEQSTEVVMPNSDCHNCGMPSLEYPKWVSRADDLYFCSPRCLMIKCMKDPKIKTATTMTVIEYYETKPLAVKDAFFVIGSDVTGPMGNDFIPFADQKAAQDFMAEHKGKKILRFADLTQELLNEALGR